MSDKIRSHIANMIYHLNTENRAQADNHLKQIIDYKVKNLYSAEFQKVKQSFSKENM